MKNRNQYNETEDFFKYVSFPLFKIYTKDKQVWQNWPSIGTFLNEIELNFKEKEYLNWLFIPRLSSKKTILIPIHQHKNN